MTDTLRSLRAILQKECRGDFAGSTDEDDIVNDAINDAVESIWMAMMQCHLARFFGADSPVTFALPTNTERYRIVSIPDPTTAITFNNVVSGALPLRTYYIASTYVTESGSETLMSPVQTVVVPANSLVQIQGTLPFVPGAFGYNVYASKVNAGLMVLQNQQPVSLATNWLEPVTGVVDFGTTPDATQAPPLTNTTADNLSWIQHLEHRTANNALHAWNQVEIDSQVMRRMAAVQSSASEYQSYVWELTGNGVLEFRPMTGSSFSPRYWYISKPRRLRYDQAEIPYVSIVGVHKFIKAQAKSDLYLGVNEFMNSQGWQQKSDKEKFDIQMSLMQELWNKNTRVVPHLW